MGLVYDRQQFSAPPQSIAVLWDPRWQGKVLAFDGSSHGFSLAAMYRGLPPFRIDPARFSLLAKDLVALRRNVRSFYSLPEESVELFRKHKVAVMHANYGQQQLKQLRDAGLDVGYVVPREGALAWLDCWAITRRSTQVALAAEWINYMLDPALSREFTRRQGLANTLEEPPALTEDVPMGPIVWLEPVEDETRRAQLWQRIVAGDRPARF
jgi:putative spermidine/putrescine transport system substrate-binding protein